MKTPIFDFIEGYAKSDATRFHMPGHKGNKTLGCEPFDITEIQGADVLYNACGIIEESEQNASQLFKTAHTFYSTEGSSLVIKAMLAMVSHAKDTTHILAARNAHKAFIYAAALLDLSVTWIGTQHRHICESAVTPHDVAQALSQSCFDAVYVTSPDYLGHMLDIKGIAEVCRAYGVPLLVDNAHGAYLAFTSPSLHPIALGADLCADSAHKTLPTLTGGAYLHVSPDAPNHYIEDARRMLSLFASTSPSYLTLASLDLTNQALFEGTPEKIGCAVAKTDTLKGILVEHGYSIEEGEPLKIVLCTADFGYKGTEIDALLQQKRILAEYADDRYIVFMISSESTDWDMERLKDALLSIPRKEKLTFSPPPIPPIQSACSIRNAILSPCERILSSDAVGRICGTPCVGCPPAIPIVMSGERITKEHVALLAFYGIDSIDVLTV